MKILHITTWYPNKENSKEALFIKRQIESLNDFVEAQTIVHMEVRLGRIGFKTYEAFGAKHIVLSLPVKFWSIIEIVSSLFTLLILIRLKSKSYDLVNFHIAYPNLTYWHLIKKFIKSKVVITEHWSAYHFNFGLPTPPVRIKKIFNQNIPVITVSQALSDDIGRFSDASFDSFIVPNVVDVAVFKPNPRVERIPWRFFMVAQWKEPKEPFIVLNAFELVVKDHPNARLVIGGYGPQLVEMKSLVKSLHLENHVDFISAMNSNEIAFEMQKARAYIHCSSYETFSVVCAEALHTGCSVVASNVGGITEFVNDQNGILVDMNDSNLFHKAMVEINERDEIVSNLNFSREVIGKKYMNALNEIV